MLYFLLSIQQTNKKKDSAKKKTLVINLLLRYCTWQTGKTEAGAVVFLM